VPGLRRGVTVGVIADTHNLLRPEAVRALRGVDRILHLGDICRPGVLDGLRELAPVDAVRGNLDHGEWAEALPVSDTWEIGGVLVHAVHDVHEIDLVPEAAAIALVLSGHSHRPRREERGGVIWLNPGSAGPRRFTLPVTLARVRIAAGRVSAEIVPLL
jgi:hypothetical protein